MSHYLQNIEKRVTECIGSQINDFLILWTIFQSQCPVSSNYCEPIGCGNRMYHRRAVGGPKGIEAVDETLGLVLHCDDKPSTLKTMHVAAANALVDAKRGVLKKDSVYDIKRQKHPNGTVIQKQDKGNETKYTSEFTLKVAEIRDFLNENL